MHSKGACGVAALAVVGTLDDVTIISEGSARAIQRSKQEKESAREQTINCTASSRPFATVVLCLTLLQLFDSEFVFRILALHLSSRRPCMIWYVACNYASRIDTCATWMNN